MILLIVKINAKFCSLLTSKGLYKCFRVNVRKLVHENFQASDIYLKMAIGNAPWPIGVDQVGIHMRPSRETISMRYVAHVLNDETQRKFIQGSGLT